MFSVVIPTLWRSPYVQNLIGHLSNIPEVGEIIIIDNDINKSIDFGPEFHKVKFIKNPQNNFVNPSWNQGVALAQYEKLCILNDDVIIPSKIFTMMDSFIDESVGMVGIAHEVFDRALSNFEDLKDDQPVTIRKCNRRNFGYGCCIFVHKKSYTIIPDGLRIQYGDDWLFYITDKQNYVLNGFLLVGKVSASLIDSDNKMFDEEVIRKICTEDHKVFWDLVDKFIIPQEPTSYAHSLKLNAVKAYRAKSRTNFYFA